MGNRTSPRRLLALTALLVAVGCGGILVTDPYEYGNVEVRAELRSGQGVPGVAVQLFSGTRVHGSGVSDANGIVRFTLVPPGPLGVSAISPDGFRLVDPIDGWVQNFVIEERTQLSRTFTLYREAPGDLRVEIRTPSGEPLDSVEVQVYSPAGTVASYFTGGQFPAVHTFAGLPFGEYGVRVVRGRGYTLPDTAPVFETVGLFVDGSVTEVADVRIAPCRGRVISEARWYDGRPIEGLAMVLYDGDGTRTEGRTGADGRFIADRTPCGDYGVRVADLTPDMLPRPNGADFIDGLALATHARDVTASFVFDQCRGDYRVTVRDDLGAPVMSAEVELYSGSGPLARLATDAAGVVTVPAAPTPCQLLGIRVIAPSGYLPELGRGTEYVDGLAPRNNAVVEIALRVRRAP